MKIKRPMKIDRFKTFSLNEELNSVEYLGSDDWGRGLYKGNDGKTYVDVDGMLHTMTSAGEPMSPAKSLDDVNGSKTMLHVDLMKKYGERGEDKTIEDGFNQYKSKISGFTDSDGDLKAGDIIEFTAGYNDDIRYTTKILGFDKDGDIYLLWDSFWAPIRKEDSRSIKVIKRA